MIDELRVIVEQAFLAGAKMGMSFVNLEPENQLTVMRHVERAAREFSEAACRPEATP